jgi:YVTN family beta-propeller protein
MINAFCRTTLMPTILQVRFRRLLLTLAVAVALFGFVTAASAQTEPKLYVSNFLDNTVSVISPDTNSVLTTINVGQYPWGVLYTSDTNQVLVAQFGSSGISVIDPMTDTLVGQIGVQGAQRLLLSKDKHILFITTGNGLILSMDRATDTITNFVQLADFPNGIASAGDGSKLFVVTDADSSLSVLDAGTLSVLATVLMPQFPRGVTVSPDGSKVYVASESGAVSILDANTYAVLATLAFPPNTDDIVFSADGSKAYVAAGSQLSTIDSGTNTVSAVTPLPSYVNSVVLGGEQQAYVMGAYLRTVYVVDLTSNHVTAQIPVGYPAWYGAFSGAPPTISIDVKPGVDSTIQQKAGGAVAVAILASSTFNPLVGINISSLHFGATGTEASLVSCGRDGEDVNKDKLLDLVCHFDVQISGLQPGATQAYLQGLTVAGDPVSAVAPVVVK